MTYFLTALIAKHLENGWEIAVSCKQENSDVVKNREFFLLSLDAPPAALHHIEAGNPLPLSLV